MYCIKCGVELADSEKVCPLCGTRVFHPDLPCGQAESPYPPDVSPRVEDVSRAGVLFVLTVLFLLPAVISVLCDWRLSGGIVWSGYVVGGLVLLYTTVVLPLWFKRPNPVIFVPVDFLVIGVYLLYINCATHGHWFMSFALPVTGTAMVLVTAVVALLRYVPAGALYICGGGLILSGGYAVLVEWLLNVTFRLHDTFLWSFYPLAVCTVLGPCCWSSRGASPCAVGAGGGGGPLPPVRCDAAPCGHGYLGLCQPFSGGAGVQLRFSVRPAPAPAGTDAAAQRRCGSHCGGGTAPPGLGHR